MFKRKRASYNEALAETQTIRRVCWWYPSKKNVLEGYTTLWWKTALTDGCKRSLMHLSLWILLIMAKIEIFHRQRPPWPSLYLSTGLEDRRSHWHVLMHSFSCQDAQNICDDKMWCWMYTEAGMTLECPGVGGRGRSPLVILHYIIIIIIIINKTHQYTVEGVQLQLNASLICFNPWRCSPLAAQFVVQRK